MTLPLIQVNDQPVTFRHELLDELAGEQMIIQVAEQLANLITATAGYEEAGGDRNDGPDDRMLFAEALGSGLWSGATYAIKYSPASTEGMALQVTLESGHRFTFHISVTDDEPAEPVSS